MGLGFKITSLILIIADLAFCIYMGHKFKDKVEDTEDYFIAGKNTGTVLLLLTTWASVNGAGNFIGQAGRGATIGIAAYWLWLGEILFGFVIFGFIVAPYLARFRYLSMPHYIANYLYGGDKTVRRAAGFASLMPNLLWPGGQIMGFAYVIQQIFQIDYKISVIICGIVFIYYTVNGGLKAVIFTDALHGTIQMIFAGLVVFFGLKAINFDINFLKQGMLSIDPARWDIFSIGKIPIISTVLVGFFGTVSNPILWNRAFAAKDVKSAKQGYGVTSISSILLVFFIIAVGMGASSFTLDAGDQSLVWLVLNKMPTWVSILLPLGVLGATMSTADTHLNCAAANIVIDIIDPENKLSPVDSLKYSKLATLIAGAIAMAGALVAPSIFNLALIGYTICGGVLIPLFAIGLLFRDKTTDEFKSNLSIKAGRVGTIAGIIAASAFELIPSLNVLFGGGIIPAVVATTGSLLLANMFFEKDTPKDVKGV